MYYFALNKYLTARKMTQGGNKEAVAFLELFGSFGTGFVFKIYHFVRDLE